MRSAFEYAKTHGYPTVTLVEKPNVIRETSGLMVREAIETVATPEVRIQILHRALHMAREHEIPTAGAALHRFVDQHLRTVGDGLGCVRCRKLAWRLLKDCSTRIFPLGGLYSNSPREREYMNSANSSYSLMNRLRYVTS